jgi:hypothetical protein
LSNVLAARLALWCSLAAAGCAAETRVSFFESSDAVLPDAAPPNDGAAIARLLHRYDFEGTGTTALDSAGGADGNVRGGAALDGVGGLVLDGEDDYVDLPNGLISGLRSATFLVWVTWHGRNICWQRIFDFGNTVQGEGVVGDALSNVFVTPLDCPGPSPLAMFGNRFGGGNTEVVIRGPIPFAPGEQHQVALVVDGRARVMRLYIDAQSHGEVGLQVGFDGIVDENNWLGRSQFWQDYHFPGRYEEFRIYSEALSASEITRLFHDGPNAL